MRPLLVDLDQSGTDEPNERLAGRKALDYAVAPLYLSIGPLLYVVGAYLGTVGLWELEIGQCRLFRFQQHARSGA